MTDEPKPKKGRVRVPSTKAPEGNPELQELLGGSPPPKTEKKPPAPVTARPRLTVYVSEEVQKAARNAVYWTNNKPEGAATISDLVEEALLLKIQELQEQYNDGQPFADMPAKTLRRGRPITREDK